MQSLFKVLSSSQTIAKNTLFLYFRMILVMGVSLFTSRIVLRELGVSDYGVYSLVGGIVALFGFFNAAMSSATQRYLSFDIEKDDQPRSFMPELLNWYWFLESITGAMGLPQMESSHLNMPGVITETVVYDTTAGIMESIITTCLRAQPALIFLGLTACFKW